MRDVGLIVYALLYFVVEKKMRGCCELLHPNCGAG